MSGWQADADKHIFVSYSHSDALLATIAVTALARARVPFFIDRVGLSRGDSLRTRLGDALDEAAAVIALLTEHSVHSQWVRRELTLLSERGTRILAYNLIRTIAAQAATKHDLQRRSISFKGTVQALAAFQPMIAIQGKE